MGCLPVDEGEIWCGRERVTEPIAGVAMVFQHFGLFPWKTVYDNVAYGLRMAGASAVEVAERVPHFIKLVGLAGFENAYPYQMSGGMQQRCGLARAGDRAERAADGRAVRRGRCADPRNPAIRAAAHLGRARPTAMIFVTHSIEEAVLLGHRVIVLKGRPSNIQKVIAVDLPHPRTRQTLQESRFAELRELVWTSLMKEAREAEFHLAR